MKVYKGKADTYRLVKETVELNRVKISQSHNAAKWVKSVWPDIEVCETFGVILLNRAHNTIGYKILSTGGISACIVDVRLLAKYAVESLCSSVILVHNHPSGQKIPSEADKAITKKAKKALDLLDIKVLDHIILMPDEGEYYSFSDEGLI